MGKVEEFLAYAGIEKRNFVRISPKINHLNRIMLAIFSGVGTVLSTVTFILSCMVDSVATNQAVFSTGALCSLVLFILSLTCAKDKAWLITPLMLITVSVYYIFSIMISVFATPNQLAVMFMVMLVFLPTVFIIKPTWMIVETVFHLILFIASCFFNKTGPVLITDIIDACLFAVLGFISGVAVSYFKLRSFNLECQLQDASRLDQLTQMNNRNSFELDLPVYPNSIKRYMGCVYIDVNGLHELNNAAGHAEGDKMLCFVADKVKEIFGREYSYRVGGDEFVAFALEATEENLCGKIVLLRSAVETEGYRVATGYKILKRSTLDMKQLVNSAEEEMYKDKRAFYESSDRKSRNLK